MAHLLNCVHTETHLRCLELPLMTSRLLIFTPRVIYLELASPLMVQFDNRSYFIQGHLHIRGLRLSTGGVQIEAGGVQVNAGLVAHSYTH
jgi:hypothetical protein